MAATITKALKDFIAGKMAWVATADKNGIPNLAPKGSLQVVDDHTLAFADLFSVKTRAALEQNRNIAVAVIETKKPEGYQFKGDAELLSSGPLYDQVKANLEKMAPGLPPPKYVVKIAVQEIYSLTPGPEAGKKLA
ncbi:pyridoxamine 5'-phosphate oxidase family protein [Desulfosarcina sp. OttesenSCG-928-G10]|nr:pyridoxamine 5'-phosphate oxidase family protein [Desulfosarcina sp. OttesenSCG-928-G10]